MKKFKITFRQPPVTERDGGYMTFVKSAMNEKREQEARKNEFDEFCRNLAQALEEN